VHVADRAVDLARMLDDLQVVSLRAFRARHPVDVPVGTAVVGT